MRVKIRMIVNILVCAFVISVVLLPNTAGNIVPQQELEFSESLTLRWQSEVICVDEGAAFLRSILDSDQDGVVTEPEVDEYVDTLKTDNDGEWIKVNSEPATISKVYTLDFSGAVGDVHDGGDFTYTVDLELSWPTVQPDSNAYNIRLTNPAYVTKAETDMNLPEDWKVIEYDNFDYAEAPNGKSDFYGELEGGGSSGLITIKKTDIAKSTEFAPFHLLLIAVAITSVSVIIMLIMVMQRKEKDQ